MILGKITLFTEEVEGQDECQEAIKLLTSNGIPFEEYNMTKKDQKVSNRIIGYSDIVPLSRVVISYNKRAKPEERCEFRFPLLLYLHEWKEGEGYLHVLRLASGLGGIKKFTALMKP